MRSLWFALLFLAGGISHEIRNPFSCQCIPAREQSGARARDRDRDRK